MKKIKSFLYYLKAEKTGILLAVVFLYGISLFFQVELSFSEKLRNGSSVFRMAELTLPISFLLILYSVFQTLTNSETKEILFSLDRSSKVWFLPLSILLFFVLCLPLIIWYAVSFDFWSIALLNLLQLSLVYGSFFCLLAFHFGSTLLSMLIVFSFHLLFYLVLPFNRIHLPSMVAKKISIPQAFLFLSSSLILLFLASLKEKRFFE